MYDVDNPCYGKLDEAGLLDRVRRLVGDAAEKEIADYCKLSPNASPYELATNIATDASVMNSIRLAERRAALGKSATYLYVFAWETPVMNTIEIPLVFDHVDVSESMVGSVRPEMRLLEAQIARAWAAFARASNPNHKGLPDWPAYTAEQRSVMIFNSPSREQDDATSQMRRIPENRPPAAGPLA